MYQIDMNTGETVQCSLFDLLGGGVKELADLNLKQVLDNIRDVNTEAKKARTITVEFTLFAAFSKARCRMSFATMLSSLRDGNSPEGTRSPGRGKARRYP